MFFVMVDGVVDIFNKENLFFVFCYVDFLKNIWEEFVGYCFCGDEIIGNVIRVLIINLVCDFGLIMDNCRG